MGEPKATKAQIEQELIDLRAEQDSTLYKARERLHRKILDDIDWWYDQAKRIATSGSSRHDQVQQVMVKTILDKVMPDRKEISRGGARIKAGRVIFQQNNAAGATPAPLPRGEGPAADDPPIEVKGPNGAAD